MITSKQKEIKGQTVYDEIPQPCTGSLATTKKLKLVFDSKGKVDTV